MRIAALYDIHGNLPALEAVLAEIKQASVDLVVVGGDFVMGPMPRQTLERLLDLGDRVRFIRGNTERELLHSMDDNPYNPTVWVARAAWVAEQLDVGQRAFLASLAETMQLDVTGLGSTLFCHGSPRSDEDIITRVTPPDRILPMLNGITAGVVVCGHTHMQFDRIVESARLVNPGSVGMPYEGTPGAYWALLGPDIELKRGRYETEVAARQIAATGFPEADEFAREHVLRSPDPDHAVRTMESRALSTPPTPPPARP